ncbi:MAG: S8 family serine peptidase [Sedimentisphaerales bacterium]|nr:S8 family serine peptidase [Sedimentisphaerales bacterium]
MKAKILIIILAVMLVLSFVSAVLAARGNNNAGRHESVRRVRVLIGFRDAPGPNEQALVNSHGGIVRHRYRFVPVIAASIPETAIQRLRGNRNVRIVEPDIKVYAVDAELDNSWGVKHIGSGNVHDGGNEGAGVKVAIIDSGIDYHHPDLDANYKGGWDFVNNDNDPMDDNGHGTHCAGIIAAEDDDSGAVGVAPEAGLYALKVLDSSGGGYYSDVIEALQWAVVNGIQVTSNSYGSSGDPGVLVKQAFDEAEAAGIINVCAAGNNGNRRGTRDNVIYPARYKSCIAVAATNQGDSRASWSSTGPDIEISAPGINVYSTYINGGYATMSGTSMACPHVSGVVALMIYAGVGDIRGTLASTAIDLGVTGKDNLYGYGLVDAEKAAGVPVEPQPQAPIANAGADQTVSDSDGDEYETITLDGSGSIDPDGSIVEYSWSEDGTILGTGRNITHDFDLGVHEVILEVTDNDGLTDIDGVVITVNENLPPIADAGSDQSVCVDKAVTFDGSGSFDPDGSIDSYEWDFGDGTPKGTGQTITHAYLATGTYIVTLTVTDNGSSVDTDTLTVTVTEQPTLSPIYVADITVVVRATHRNARATADVFIVDGSGNPVSGAIVTAEWTFEGYYLSETSGITNSMGEAVLSSPRVRARSGVFTIKITDVVKSGWTYVYEDDDWASISFH